MLRDPSSQDDVANLLQLDDLVLLHDLHGIHLSVTFIQHDDRGL